MKFIIVVFTFQTEADATQCKFIKLLRGCFYLSNSRQMQHNVSL
ncbi:hypothetical protein HMPREF9144_1144 [Prevotella pallens ATCC 700821]|uniref:Uncharacterized protein n=1 Tax=Prevotella pallens ATCC 700821 TaxID=997353 RepID=F9DHK4_9BACT|nr:hypothetical protein HMPREF9144_1144 [Prevotella pallens ATCC 700821]